MTILYHIAIYFYGLLLRVASLFSPKAALWVNGRKDSWTQIQEQLKANETRVWFHCASLGEFEQGRPLIEAYREKYPTHKIVLSFFSPSGYEIRKNYQGADYIFYLPLDTPSNARKWLQLIQPQCAFFIKYEFWRNYLYQLHQQQIPTYLVAGIFRKEQLFFKWYGKFFKNILSYFTHLFVQNQYSLQLLKHHQIHHASYAPDTRFDRVAHIAQQAKELPFIEQFKGEKKLLVLGSSWPADESLFATISPNILVHYKLLIAPHEIHESHLQQIESLYSGQCVRYSVGIKKTALLQEQPILIIDNIGMLSSIYQYGDITYIGGGFGVGIHNILEAAIFGMPIIFGPNYHKFQEAKDLVDLKAAFSIQDTTQLQNILQQLQENQSIYNHASQQAQNYVQQHTGGTQLILQKTNHS